MTARKTRIRPPRDRAAPRPRPAPPQPPPVAAPRARRVRLYVDPVTLFVYAGGVKIGRYIAERRAIEIADRCKARAGRAGEFVEVPLDQFAQLETLRCKAQAGQGE